MSHPENPEDTSAGTRPRRSFLASAAAAAADEEDMFLSRGAEEPQSDDDEDDYVAPGFEDEPAAPAEVKEN